MGSINISDFNKRNVLRTDKKGKIYKEEINEKYRTDEHGNLFFENGNFQANKCTICQNEIKPYLETVNIIENQIFYKCECGSKTKSLDEKKIHKTLGHNVETINEDVTVGTKRIIKGDYIIKNNKITCGRC